MFPKEQQIHHPNRKQSNQQDEGAMKHNPQDPNGQPHSLGESFEHHAFDETRRSYCQLNHQVSWDRRERERERERESERERDRER